MVLFREFHRFGPNLEIEFRITFVLDEFRSNYQLRRALCYTNELYLRSGRDF